LSEENKQLVRAYLKAIDEADDWSVVDEYVSPDFVTHNPIPGFGSDRDGVKASSAMFKAATPDGKHVIDDQVAEGDKVVSRIVGYGTQTGEMLGVPPTGQKVETAGIAIHRISGGKIVEHWSVVDMATVFAQLGLFEPPAEGSAPP
jgi:steroid delta-isomerase-like uncharacterized protein